MRNGWTANIGAMSASPLLTMVIAAPAQVTTGSMTGTVKDTQDGAIPGATVVLVSEARGDQVRADDDRWTR